MLIVLIRGLALFAVLGLISVGLYDTGVVTVFGLVGVGGWFLALFFFFFMAVGCRWES